MIRVEGKQNQSHDPKLKLPATVPLDDRADVAVEDSRMSELGRRLDVALDRIGLLETRVTELENRPPGTAPVTEDVTKIVTEPLTTLPQSGNGNGNGNAVGVIVKMTPAEKQRAYRDRLKAKRDADDDLALPRG